MSKTELTTYTMGTRSVHHGAGELSSVLENNEDSWRAAIDINIEAPDERKVEEIAEDIVEQLSELGYIDKI